MPDEPTTPDAEAPQGAADPPPPPDSAAADTPTPEAEAPPEEPRTVIDAAADLLQLVVDYLRQEVASIVREKIALPLQMVGLTAAWAGAAASCLVIGLIFIAIAALLLLAQALTWPGALFVIGAVFVIGSVVFTVLKVRTMQK